MVLPEGWLLQLLTIGASKIGTGVLGYALNTDIVSLSNARDAIKDQLTKLSPEDIEEASMSGMIPFVGQVFPPWNVAYQSGYGKLHELETTKLFETARLTPGEFMTLFYRKYFSTATLQDWENDLLEQGYNRKRINALTEVARPILQLAEIRDLFLRGELGEGDEGRNEAIARIEALGYHADNATQLLKLFYYIPSPQDMVTWQAKEVFEPDAIEKYGLDDEFELLDLSLFRKAGVSPEMARNYWRAHWQHPSFIQISEMLHRGFLEEPDVWEWFRLVEIPPYWRQKLINIIYTPFTRVDVRRMYREGVLNRDEVFQSYKDIGYDNWHAEKLTLWTEKYYSPEDTSEDKEFRTLTLSTILKGYHELELDRSWALEQIQALDYSPEAAEMYVALEDLDIAEEAEKDTLNYITEAYRTGAITDDELLDLMGKLNMPAVRQDYYISKIRRTRQTTIAVPSLSDFKRWLSKGFITPSAFEEELTIKGYHPRHIRNYLRELT